MIKSVYAVLISLTFSHPVFSSASSSGVIQTVTNPSPEEQSEFTARILNTVNQNGFAIVTAQLASNEEDADITHTLSPGTCEGLDTATQDFSRYFKSLSTGRNAGLDTAIFRGLSVKKILGSLNQLQERMAEQSFNRGTTKEFSICFPAGQCPFDLSWTQLDDKDAVEALFENFKKGLPSILNPVGGATDFETFTFTNYKLGSLAILAMVDYSVKLRAHTQTLKPFSEFFPNIKKKARKSKKQAMTKVKTGLKKYLNAEDLFNTQTVQRMLKRMKNPSQQMSVFAGVMGMDLGSGASRKNLNASLLEGMIPVLSFAELVAKAQSNQEEIVSLSSSNTAEHSKLQSAFEFTSGRWETFLSTLDHGPLRTFTDYLQNRTGMMRVNFYGLNIMILEMFDLFSSEDGSATLSAEQQLNAEAARLKAQEELFAMLGTSTHPKKKGKGKKRSKRNKKAQRSPQPQKQTPAPITEETVVVPKGQPIYRPPLNLEAFLAEEMARILAEEARLEEALKESLVQDPEVETNVVEEPVVAGPSEQPFESETPEDTQTPPAVEDHTAKPTHVQKPKRLFIFRPQYCFIPNFYINWQLIRHERCNHPTDAYYNTLRMAEGAMKALEIGCAPGSRAEADIVINLMNTYRSETDATKIIPKWEARATAYLEILPEAFANTVFYDDVHYGYF